MSARTIAFIAAALVGTGLPGCLGDEDAAEDVPPPPRDPIPDWVERALPFGGDHDHFDAAQHQGLTTANFQLVGWDPLLTGATGGTTAGGYFCGEARVRDDGRRFAVVNSFYSGVAFVLADVTDPAHPEKVGEFVLPYEGVYDVAMTPDALHVVVGANPQPPELPLPLGSVLDGGAAARATWRDACGGERPLQGPLPNGPSVILVGIEDPSAPVIEDVVPMPVLGPHSVGAADVDGTTIVSVSVTNLAHQGSYYAFYDLAGDRLQPRTAYQAPPQPESEQPIINGHVDATVAKHPVTGQVLAYLADWDAGVVVLDISGPVPQRLSQFSEFTGGGGYVTGVETGNVHEAVPIEGLWDGRHYVLAGQEILGHPDDHPSGWVWVLDDTDPTALQLVGRWTLPVDVEWDLPLQFSTHYISLLGRTAFVSVYHGGVWAIDLSTPQRLALPASVGVFVPANESPDPPTTSGGDMVGAPTIMETAVLPGGDIVVWDAGSGVYLVRFDPAVPLAVPDAWETAPLDA